MEQPGTWIGQACNIIRPNALSVGGSTVRHMAANPSNPHDAYFRNVLGRPAEAASELRLVLPREIVARLDWATLEVQSGTFVSDELRSRQSDLLFRTRLDGHNAFVYILLEHQSRSDNLMPFRMLEYIVSIWNHYLRAQPDARSLPPIIPVVVHVGPTGCRWTAPMDVAELIDVMPTPGRCSGITCPGCGTCSMMSMPSICPHYCDGL